MKTINKDNPVVICLDENGIYFNKLYIPSKETLESIKLFLDNFIGLSNNEIANINRNITDYWDGVMEEKESLNKIGKNFKNDTPGYIYMYKQADKYKIGRSSKIDCREKKYITENPDLIEVVFKAKVKNYCEAESVLHRLFRFSRINEKREWFLLNESELNFFKNIENKIWTKDFEAEIILNKLTI